MPCDFFLILYSRAFKLSECYLVMQESVIDLVVNHSPQLAEQISLFQLTFKLKFIYLNVDFTVKQYHINIFEKEAITVLYLKIWRHHLCQGFDGAKLSALALQFSQGCKWIFAGIKSIDDICEDVLDRSLLCGLQLC